MLRRFRDRRRPYSGVPETFDGIYYLEAYDEDDEHDAVERALSTPQHEDGDATKTILNAIHVQVVPPSSVDNRGAVRSHQQFYTQRLDQISQRLRSESPSLWREPQAQEDSSFPEREPSGRYNHKPSVTVDTNTTTSNTASTPSGTMKSGRTSTLTRDTRCHVPLLRNLALCGKDDCTLPKAVCMDAILSHEVLLNKVSSDEASLDDLSLIHI